MKKYRVILTRAYAVDIYAKNIEDAKGLTEFFIGDPADASNEIERERHAFRIEGIEMTMNEVFEADEYHEN